MKKNGTKAYRKAFNLYAKKFCSKKVSEFMKYNQKEKAENSIKQYEAASDFLKKNTHIMVKMAFLTIIQRLAYFAVTFCVAKALHVEDCDIVDVIALQVVLSLAVDILPIPGASGVNEIVFVRLQTMIFGTLVSAGLLLNRGITYYLFAVVTGIFTLIAHLYFNKIANERKKNKEG